jgi:hypothetical protein
MDRRLLRLRLLPTIVALTVAFTAAGVQAQPLVFVDAAGLVDHDPTSFGPTGTVAGVGAGAGIMLSPHFSIRFEVDLPQWYVRGSSYRVRVLDHIEANSSRDARRTIAY